MKTDQSLLKQFLHIDEAECILCEGCVDICPWKCIHYLSTDAIEDSINVEAPNMESVEVEELMKKNSRRS